MQQQGYLFPGKSLDAPGYAESKVNALESGDNLPEEIL